jgi:DNA-binding NtrC family response regulator
LWHFIEVFHRRYKRRIDAISPAVMKLLTQYPWPGNVRELRSVVEHGFVMGDGPVFDVEDVTPEIRGEPPPGGAPGHTAEAAPGSQERQRLLAALATHGGRVTAAAASLGMSRWTLWRKLGAAGLR